MTVSIRKFRILVLVLNQIEYWSNYSIRFEISNIRTLLASSDKACGIDTTECSACGVWNHRQCIPLTQELFTRFRHHLLLPPVVRCTCQGTTFDFVASIERYVTYLLLSNDSHNDRLTFTVSVWRKVLFISPAHVTSRTLGVTNNSLRDSYAGSRIQVTS